MTRRITIDQFISENFDDVTMRQIIFKAAWQQSPIGKDKFQELARVIGGKELEKENKFYSLMQDAGLSHVEETEHNGQIVDRKFIFDGLFCIPYLP